MKKNQRTLAAYSHRETIMISVISMLADPNGDSANVDAAVKVVMDTSALL